MTSRTLNVEAEISVGTELQDKRTFRKLDVMNMSRVKRWVTLQFNKVLHSAPRGAVVVGKFYGKLTQPPYTAYSGQLTGVSGRIVARLGAYDG